MFGTKLLEYRSRELLSVMDCSILFLNSKKQLKRRKIFQIRQLRLLSAFFLELMSYSTTQGPLQRVDLLFQITLQLLSDSNKNFQNKSGQNLSEYLTLSWYRRSILDQHSSKAIPMMYIAYNVEFFRIGQKMRAEFGGTRGCLYGQK